jgi:uncharacterized protein YggE
MKQILTGLMLLLVLSFSSYAQPGAIGTYGNTTTLTVTGEGMVSLPPDVIAISVSVQTADANATAAAAENLRILNETLAALQTAGVKRDNIGAGYYIINQVPGSIVQVCGNTTLGSNLTSNATNASMASVTSTLNDTGVMEPAITNATNITCRTVRLPPTTQINNQLLINMNTSDGSEARLVLDSAIAAGATEARIVGYGLQDPKAAVEQARKRAFENARMNAEMLSSVAGVSLERMVDIIEPIAPTIEGSRLAQSAAQASGPGTIDVRASVTVTYQVSKNA